jgi:TolB-like protein/DNA-binding winged helix-turn-helix (wHTH) protein/Tfp pilus assembly protein PilF
MSSSAPASPGPSNVIRFGVFELDVRTLELRKAGQRIRVQQQPLQILAILLERRGAVVTREELRAALWPSDVYVDFDHSLNKAIVKLREALNDSANAPRFIETLPRIGYRFIVDEPAKETAAAADRPRMRRLAVVIATVAVALIAALWLGWRSRPPTSIRSLAILPLENLSGDASQEYFADGMTDELTTALAQIGQLRVISRTSVMRYKSTRKSVPEIARELNVDALIEGSVMRAGNRVRITAQLIDARKDKHLWAHSYEGESKDVLGLQDAVARDVAEKMRLKLTPIEQARLNRSRPVNPEAHEAYLNGVFHWSRRDAVSVAKALEMFHRAIAIDPNYAAPYAGIAHCYIVMTFYGDMRGVDAQPHVLNALHQAIALDPDSAEAHTGMGAANFFYVYDWRAAEDEFRRAIALNPNYVTAHAWYAQMLGGEGRTEEAIAQHRAAMACDPLSLITLAGWGQRLYRAHRYDEAVVALNRVLDLDASYASGQTHWMLGGIYIKQNKFPQAIAELKQAEKGPTAKAVISGTLGQAYALSGDRGRAVTILQTLLNEKQYVDPYAIALVYIGLGDKDRAFAFLNKSIDDRDGQIVHAMNQPALDTLRSDPRFAELIRRMNIPVARDH